MTLCLGETSPVSRPPTNLLQLKLGLSLMTLSYLVPGMTEMFFEEISI